MKTVMVYSCNNVLDAERIIQLLEGEGISTVSGNQNMSTLYPGMGGAATEIPVFVLESDYERAMEILKACGEMGNDAITCPHCGSTDVKMVRKQGVSIFSYYGALLMSMLSAAPFPLKNFSYLCKKCGKRFE